MKKQRLLKILISVLTAIAVFLLPVAPAFAAESSDTLIPFVEDYAIGQGEVFTFGFPINSYSYVDLGVSSYSDIDFDYDPTNTYYMVFEYGGKEVVLESSVTVGEDYYKFISIEDSTIYVMIDGLSEDASYLTVSQYGQLSKLGFDYGTRDTFKLWLGYADIWRIDGGNISSGEVNQTGDVIRPEFEGGFQYGSSGALLLDCVTARDNSEDPDSYVAVYEGSMNVNYTMYPIEQYTYYTGAAFFYLTLDRLTWAGDAIAMGNPNVWVSDLNTPDDSYRVTFGINRVSSDSVRIMVCMYFNNYYVTTASSPNVNFTINMRQAVVVPDLMDITQYNWGGWSDQDWAGTVFATKSPASQNIDSVYDAAEQQMQQQQQLAQQHAAQQESLAASQSQQSAKQHDELINGFDNSDAESGQANFDNTLSSFESQESAILDDAMTNIDAVDMDTSVFDQLVPTFEFIRIVFMSLVAAMGDFGVLITITLSICLALFAIGWFRS